MNLLCTDVVIILATLVLISQCTTASSLMKSSSWPGEINNILSVLFGFDENQLDMKYDKQANKWVEECPAVICENGIHKEDDQICPYCLLGPGEKCGEWKGECGEELVCQYKSSFSSTGKCVTKEEFKSRQVGESCGQWEGQCKNNLKCQIDPDPWAFLCGTKKSGVCVTNEHFSSRQEGESCGELAGECKAGLKCVENDLCWMSSSVCMNVTKNSDHPHHKHGFTIEEIVFDPDSNDDKVSEHVVIEVDDDNKNADEAALESLIESEMLNPLSNTFEKETKLIEKIIHAALDGKEANNTKTKSAKDNESLEDSLKIDASNPESEKIDLAFYSESNPNTAKNEKQMALFNPIIKIL